MDGRTNLSELTIINTDVQQQSSSARQFSTSLRAQRGLGGATSRTCWARQWWPAAGRLGAMEGWQRGYCRRWGRAEV